MQTTADLSAGARARGAQAATVAALYAVAVATAGASAVLVKEYRARSGPPPALAAVDVVRGAPAMHEAPFSRGYRVEAASAPAPEMDAPAAPSVAPAAEAPPTAPAEVDADVRWFNGRPVRPARTIVMTVTAYSPDARSCGEHADGYTATLHSVWTNGFKMVAADTRLLPFGSLLTVPGYDSGRIVPVLDRGGAIKGRRLDVLFPTHEEAMKWGVRKVPVTVWEYADGKPADDPRRFR